MAEKDVHSGHRSRMRKKCLNFGTGQLEDHELIEMLLNYCIPMKDTNPTAHMLLKEYGSITSIINSTPKDMCERMGFTENTSLIFSLIAETIRRIQNEKFKQIKKLDSVSSAGSYALTLLGGFQDVEKFYVIGLDSAKKILGNVLISKGTVNETNINARLVAEAALSLRSVSVILVHNHPSGSLTPSTNDISLTLYLTNMLNMLGIDVVDHIIVSNEDYLSMNSVGLIKNKI